MRRATSQSKEPGVSMLLSIQTFEASRSLPCLGTRSLGSLAPKSVSPASSSGKSMCIRLVASLEEAHVGRAAARNHAIDA